MQSVIQKKSYNSVKVFWLNKELLQYNIKRAVEKLVFECPEVEKIVLFGSVADSRETPSSDIDILIVISDSQYRFLDRAQFFRTYFQDIGLGTDIFVYTHKEIEKENLLLAKSALKRGRVLFEK